MGDAAQDQSNTTPPLDKPTQNSPLNQAKLKAIQIWNVTKEVASNPKSFWDRAKDGNSSISQVYMETLVIAAAIPVLSSFIATSIIGISVPILGTFRFPIFPNLVAHLFQYAALLAAIYLSAIAVTKILPKLGTTPSLTNTFKLIAYSFLPSLVAGIIGIFPAIGMLGSLIVGLYSLYILYLGVQPMLGVPADKVPAATGVVVGSCIIVGVVLAYLVFQVSPQPIPSEAFELLQKLPGGLR